MPFFSVSSLPAKKGDVTFINITLSEIKANTKEIPKEDLIPVKETERMPDPKIELKKKANIIPKKPKEIKKEIVKLEEPKDVIPIAEEVEEQPKEEEKEEIIEEKKFSPPPPSISKEVFTRLRESYEDKILKKIHSMKHYPLTSQRRGHEGVVRLAFTVNKDGSLHGTASVIKPCRYARLNDSAVKTISASNPFPPFPEEIKKEQMTFSLDIDFHMEVW
ncbi:MAG: TonB family protein [Candidatus Omnitrophica bacterium]|nr:TonB family protein [Candidatus Omnitrophota bacterium]